MVKKGSLQGNLFSCCDIFNYKDTTVLHAEQLNFELDFLQANVKTNVYMQLSKKFEVYAKRQLVLEEQ
jgi:hypothetical protein